MQQQIYVIDLYTSKSPTYNNGDFSFNIGCLLQQK